MNITYIDEAISDADKATVKMPNIYDSILVGSTKDDNIFRIPTTDFFLKYKRELEGCKVLYSISQELFYKPKLLSLQVYGTTELWLAILRANNMRNVIEFHYPVIQLYDPERLTQLIKVFFKREGKF